MRSLEHPVTIAKCDGVLATGPRGEIFLNEVLATDTQCWIRLHIVAEQSARFDAFQDLQTWNQDSLDRFRADPEDLYDLQLLIDGQPVSLRFGPGNGGGLYEGARELHWTQSLVFPINSTQRSAIVKLRWMGLELQGAHEIDISYVRQCVADDAY